MIRRDKDLKLQLFDSNFVSKDFNESYRNRNYCMFFFIFQSLPREMLELILLKSMVGIMSVNGWRMFEITNPYPEVTTYMKQWPTKLGCLQTSV